jgi:ketosteroid isomerase-like protein
MAQQTEHRDFGAPDEVREFPNGRAEILKVGSGDVGRLRFEPGWRWSRDVRAIAGTDSCTAPHFQYHVAGSLAVRMDDGTEFVAGPGAVTSLPSGHDAWVVGDEPVVVVDWFGASHYAESPADAPEEVVNAFGAAWAARDLAAALDMLSEDCLFESTGPAPDGERHIGRAAIESAWREIFEDADARFEPEETFSAGDRVLQRWRYSFAGGHVRGVDVFKVADGKISEKLSYVKG